MHCSLDGLDSPLANGHERSGFQDLKLCTVVLVRKTSPLLMIRRKVVYNIWSHALEFGWVPVPVPVPVPLTNGLGRIGLQYL